MIPHFDPEELDDTRARKQAKYAKRQKGEAKDRYNMAWFVRKAIVIGEYIYGGRWNQWRNMWNKNQYHKYYNKGPFRRDEAQHLNRRVRRRVKEHLRRYDDMESSQYEQKMPWLD